MEKEKKRTLTIKNEIFLLSFAFLALVSLIFAGIFFEILFRENLKNAKNSLRECNSQIVTYTEAMFHENASMVRILTEDATIVNGGNGDPSLVLSIFDSVLEGNTNITYLYSGYEDGSLYISEYDKPMDYDATKRPWYQAAKEADGVAQLVYRDAATGDWLFSQCHKLVDSEGRMTGALAIDCSNENISRQLSTRYQYDSQRSYIMDPNGMVLIHPEEKYINDSLLNYMDEKIWEAVIDGTDNYGEYQKDGVHAMAYFERIPETQFMVATAIDASEVARPIIRGMAYLFLLVVGISIALGYILSRVLTYRFARPILALKDRIENVAAGRPEATTNFSYSNAEIKGIARSIEVIVKDIARREEQRRSAEYLSFHDSMTGLYNRRFFDEEQWRLDTKRNYPLCIICCDVDGLKLVNDVFGHDIGDRLICRVAECLILGCRADDILARIGGDEFAILMPHTSGAEAEKIMERIRAGIPRENICGAEVSISLGYAIKESKEESLDEIMRQADQMMYGRKLNGSAEMKRRTTANIIRMAVDEGWVGPLTEKEVTMLDRLAQVLCPDARELLKQSYRLRNIGLCTVFQANGINEGGDGEIRHTENAYRLFSMVDEYRSAAGYVLHYTEHWDGSGCPAGLSGHDIPLISRVIAVADAYFSSGGDREFFGRKGSWFDPEIMSVLACLLASDCKPD